MQSPALTGKSKLRCLAIALLAMLTPLSALALTILVALWAIGPTVVAFLRPAQWAVWPRGIQWAVLACAAAVVIAGLPVIWHGCRTNKTVQQQRKEPLKSTREAAVAPSEPTRSEPPAVQDDDDDADPDDDGERPVKAEKSSRWPAVLGGAVLVTPLAVAVGAVAVRYAMGAGGTWSLPGLNWWATGAAVVLSWLVLTLAALAGLAGALAVAGGHFLTEYAEKVNFGLVPGVVRDKDKPGWFARWIDRLAGGHAGRGRVARRPD
jgi:hypothetical protein